MWGYKCRAFNFILSFPDKIKDNFVFFFHKFFFYQAGDQFTRSLVSYSTLCFFFQYHHFLGLLTDNWGPQVVLSWSVLGRYQTFPPVSCLPVTMALLLWHETFIIFTNFLLFLFFCSLATSLYINYVAIFCKYSYNTSYTLRILF